MESRTSSSTSSSTRASKSSAYTILVISIVSLPCTVGLAIFPQYDPIPILSVFLPLGMILVGYERLSQSLTLKLILRWSSLVIAAIAIVDLGSMLYMTNQSMRGFEFGGGKGEYNPIKLSLFFFAPLLFLYSSASDTVRRYSSVMVWIGFILIMVVLCIFALAGVMGAISYIAWGR
jgi:hypothetical protein